MVLPNISASDPQEEQVSTIRSRELAEQQALLAEQDDPTRRTLTAQEAEAIRQQQVEEQIASGIEDPVAEQRLLEQQRQQAEAERQASATSVSTVTEEQAEQRRRLTQIAQRELARGGATDEAAGIVRITRSEFERRQKSPILAQEVERARRENRERIPSALGVNIKNQDFDARKARLEKLSRSDDPRVKEAAKIGIDLEALRERGRINTEELNQMVEIQGAIDPATGKGKSTVARVAVDTAGDIGLSMIPIFGTARDANRVARNWDNATNSERALDTGLLAVSAVGDVLTVFGVGVFLKGAATGARTARTTTKVITATADKADDLKAIADAAKATNRTISRFEVSAVPDPKLADEAAKLATQFPKKTLDIVIQEPSPVAIKSAGRIDDVIVKAKDTSKRSSRFVLELDRPNMNTKEIDRIAKQLGEVAAGKAVPLAKGSAVLPKDPATVLIRRINRGLSREGIEAQAVEIARMSKLLGTPVRLQQSGEVTLARFDTRSFNEIRKQALKELKKRSREAGERDIREASETLATKLRQRGIKNVEFEDIDFDSTKNVTVKLSQALPDKEITRLVQELEQQAGRIPTPLVKGSSKYPTDGREIVIDQIARGKDINRTRNKLIAELKRRKLKVSRQKDERVLRLEPDDTPTQGAFGGRKGDTGRGGGLAVLEKPKTTARSAPRVSQTTQRTTRAVSGRGRGTRRLPFSVPVPGRGDQPGRGRGREPEPGDTPSDIPEPDNIGDPDVTPDPDPDPVPDFVPEPDPDPAPDPTDDPTRTITGTDVSVRRKGRPDDPERIVKAAPDLQNQDGKQLFPVVFNWRQGKFFKQRDIRTGKTLTFKRIPQGGIESGKTPQETLKAVGFDDTKPKKSRFPISSKVSALIDNRRISFSGSRGKLGE